MKLSTILHRIPHEALAVYVYLDERATLDTILGLTQQEISRATRLSVGAVRESLGWLSAPYFSDASLVADPSPSPLISIKKFSKAHKIVLLEPWNDGREVRFTYEDTDDRRLAKLEAELKRLALPSKSTPRLSLYLKGDRQAVISEIEADLGRPITIEEAFLLGGILGGYEPERLKQAWRRHAANLDKPVVALYAMFMKERFGKLAQAREDKEPEQHYTTYTRYDETF